MILGRQKEWGGFVVAINSSESGGCDRSGNGESGVTARRKRICSGMNSKQTGQTSRLTGGVIEWDEWKKR